MKRTPMKRSTPLRANAKASAAVKPLKPKKCNKAKGGCGATFTPSHPFVCWCSPECGLAIAQKQQAKKAQREAIEDRKETRAKLDGMKKLGELRKEAQDAFNRYIRLRDQNRPCICCGEPLGDPRYGGAYDAGHFLSRGSHPNLAFDERNVNAQRKGCNRPGGTTSAKFRAGMVARYGLAAVEALEADQTLRQYRHEDYREIKATYRAKARELEKQSP